MLGFAFVFATGLDLHPWELVRVDDPNYPGADATSATGAVLLEPPPPGVKWRHEPVPVPDRAVATEALSATNADRWHAAGLTGKGVKIAVFDLLWFGAEVDPLVLGDVQTHDCYTQRSCELPFDTFRPRFTWEEGQHGYACAEVIRDIAPDAELHLVRTNGFTSFENAVDWAIRNDIDLISQSLSYFNSSNYDGTGPFAAPVDRLAAHDTLLVTSAGNYARQHWAGTWTDGDNDGRLDADGDNGLWTWLDSGSGSFVVSWNQFGSCGTTDLNAFVYDADRNIVGRGEATQDADGDECSPTERITATGDEKGWYRLEIEHVRGPTAWVDVTVYARSGILDAAIPEGSIVDPGVHPRAFTVGAVNATGYLANDVEGFSSWGPTGGGASKPDIAGPDGLTTTAYGPRGFFGTSASTPAVTGLLALVMEEDPTLTPQEAAERLQLWALSDNTLFSPPDPRWGAGKARLPVHRDEPRVCGRRPLLMPLFLLPLSWVLRRRTKGGLSRRKPR